MPCTVRASCDCSVATACSDATRAAGSSRKLPEWAADLARLMALVTAAAWDFDEETYLSDGSFTRELLDTANGMNVRMFEQDERLYCYPALVRILPGERAVLIDRDRERRLRPKVLVAHLQAIQRRPLGR